MSVSDRKFYHAVFFATNGLGPWPCFFCGELVFFEETDRKLMLHVHHVDKDHGNRTPENLVPAHNSCHMSHHNKGRPAPWAAATMRETQKIGVVAAHTPEANAKRKESLRRWREDHPEEFAQQAARSAEKRTGQKRTPEQKERMRQAAVVRRRPGPCAVDCVCRRHRR